MSVFIKATGTIEQENSIESNLKGMSMEICSPYLAFLNQEVENEMYNMECNDYPKLLDISDEEFNSIVQRVADDMYNNSLLYEAITEYVKEHIDLVLNEMSEGVK